MSRQARVVAEGVPHHVTQRGNNRRDVFLLEDDRRFYIDVLREKCARFGVTILGWCLMTNHVHLIAVPRRENSLAKALGQTHWQHAMRFNQRYQRSGHLWQNRFYSCPLGRDHLEPALAYVDRNPVRAGLVGKAAEYPWSSAAAHLSGRDEGGLMDERTWAKWGFQDGWEDLLATDSAGSGEEELRRATYGGLALGDDAFVTELEQKLQRRLRPKPPGRVPKAAAQAASGK